MSEAKAGMDYKGSLKIRLILAWYVLRGFSVGYRLKIKGFVDFAPRSKGRLVQCTVDERGEEYR